MPTLAVCIPLSWPMHHIASSLTAILTTIHVYREVRECLPITSHAVHAFGKSHSLCVPCTHLEYLRSSWPEVLSTLPLGKSEVTCSSGLESAVSKLSSEKAKKRQWPPTPYSYITARSQRKGAVFPHGERTPSLDHIRKFEHSGIPAITISDPPVATDGMFCLRRVSNSNTGTRYSNTNVNTDLEGFR